MKAEETVTRFGEPTKGFWLKQPTPLQTNSKWVFVLIHQNTGFVNSRHTLYKKYENLEKQMKQMGNMGYVGTKMLNPFQWDEL